MAVSFQFVKPNLLGSGNLFLCRGNDGFELGIEASLRGGRSSLGGSGLGSLHGFHDGSELRIDFLIGLHAGKDGFELGVEILGGGFGSLFGLEFTQDGFELGIEGISLLCAFAKCSNLVTEFGELVTHGGFYHGLTVLGFMTCLVVSDDAFAESFLLGHVALALEGFHYCANTFTSDGFHIVGLDGIELGINIAIHDTVEISRSFSRFYGRLFTTFDGCRGSRFFTAFDSGFTTFVLDWLGRTIFREFFGVRVTRIFNHGSSLTILGFCFSRLFFVFGRSLFTTFVGRAIVKGFVTHAIKSAEQVILFGTTFTTFSRSSFTTFTTFVTEVEFTDSVGAIVSRSFTTFITNVEIEGIVPTFSSDLGTRFGHVEIEVTFGTGIETTGTKVTIGTHGTEAIVRIGIESRGFGRFSETTRSFRRKFAHTGSSKRIGSRSFTFTTIGKVGSHAVRLGFGHILRSQAAIGIAGNLVKEGSQVLRNVIFALDLHHERDKFLVGEGFTTISLQFLGKLINDKSLSFAVHFFLTELREGRHAIRVLVHGHIQDVIRCVVQRFVGSFVVWIEAKTANGFTNGPCILDAEEVRDSFLVHFL